MNIAVAEKRLHGYSCNRNHKKLAERLVDSMRIHIFASDKTLLYEKTNFINNLCPDGSDGSGAE